MAPPLTADGQYSGMSAMNTAAIFLKNTWYVAAWSHEVAADGMLARTITRVPLLLWRDSTGQVIAFDDRCCHRAAPLSMGRREGDHIRCMYHGLLYDKTGKCVEIPSQEFIPPAAKVRAYPVVERFKWVWIWMGDAQAADPSLIPIRTTWMTPGGGVRRAICITTPTTCSSPTTCSTSLICRTCMKPRWEGPPSTPASGPT